MFIARCIVAQRDTEKTRATRRIKINTLFSSDQGEAVADGEHHLFYPFVISDDFI